MTDPELRARLQALRPPGASGTIQSRALHRATLALRAGRLDRINVPSAPPASRSGVAPFLLITRALLGALAILALGFWWLRPAPPAATPLAEAPDERLDALRLLAEVQALFPSRLNAVIERDGALQIDLADNADHLPSDQAIIVRLARADQVVRILGYSGRALDLDIGGQALRFVPLITGEGEVLLEGESFAWNASLPTPPPLAGWSIDARPL